MKLVLAAAAATLNLLAAHPDSRAEWWYHTGHVSSASGRRFGFELTFFRAKLPDGNDLDAAHFAITDVSGKQFHLEERLHRPFPGIAGADPASLFVFEENWEAREDHGKQLLKAKGNDIALDLRLDPDKPAILNGASGISRKGAGPDDYSHYLSIPRLSATGSIRVNRTTEPVTGMAWFDHEFGPGGLPKGLAGWDWFSLQLSDRTEVMLYRLRLADGTVSDFSSGTFVAADGAATNLLRRDFETRATGSWKSAKSGATYPAGWNLRIPKLRIDVDVLPLVADQELLTPHSTRVTYWEGACSVTGTHAGRRVTGDSYVELTGYAGRDLP